MTLTQIKKLLDHLQESVERISTELSEETDIDAPVERIKELGRRAEEITNELRVLADKIRNRAETQSDMADAASNIADELEGVVEQLAEFND